MPTYTYQVIHDDGSEGEIFEVVQPMSEPAWTEHPETGEKVVRVFSAPNIAGPSDKERFSEKNLERLGFTKYQRSGKGNYEKRVGQGPDTLSPE